MGRSDDSISRRRNKKNRKKQENKRDSTSKVSTRVASIIAAKKRRQSGKRRICEGMCFSLPTPEDPFNERQGKTEPSTKRKRDSKSDKLLGDKHNKIKRGSANGNNGRKDTQEPEFPELKKAENGKSASVALMSFMGPEIAVNLGKPTYKVIKWDSSKHSWKAQHPEESMEHPSKFLMMCLDTIQNFLQHTGALSSIANKPLFADEWGVEFWNCYSSGKDVLGTDGSNSRMERIAWMASSAADTISMKEKEGMSFAGPFLLYLVPSKDKASKVRQVCKPLKSLGIHTVSLHSDASIDHQINGLKNCEPEFLVSTPERLLELLSMKAIDISGVSLLAIDGLEAPFEGTYFDAIKSIRQYISGALQTVVFCDCMKMSSMSVVQQLLGGTASK